jgi:hypothetical protein
MYGSDVRAALGTTRQCSRETIGDLVLTTARGGLRNKLGALYHLALASSTAKLIPGNFRFCLACGVFHTAAGKDALRLASLSGEGEAPQPRCCHWLRCAACVSGTASCSRRPRRYLAPRITGKTLRFSPGTSTTPCRSFRYVRRCFR